MSSSRSLASRSPQDTEARRDSRHPYPRFYTNDVHKRSRSSSTPPNTRLVHNQQRSDSWSVRVQNTGTTGNLGDTVQAQGQGLIESAAQTSDLRHRHNSDARPRVITKAPLNWPRKDSYRRPKILFYHKQDPYYGFTNFSPHPVTYEGKKYPTSEHLFQSFKFSHRPKLAEHIRTCCPRPSDAFSEARRFAYEVRSDWSRENIKAMDIAIYNKFSQHKDLKRELLATGDAELIENSDKDAFWGCGADGKGKNELGKALERLRVQLLEKERR